MTPMSDSSRRGFLKIAGASAAVGAAAVATTAALRGAEPDSVAGASAAAALPRGASGPLVAYVRDVRSGEIAVLVGETEVVVHDRALVARLAAARTSRSA